MSRVLRCWSDEKANVVRRVREILDNAEYPTEIRIDINMSTEALTTIDYHIYENIAVLQEEVNDNE